MDREHYWSEFYLRYESIYTIDTDNSLISMLVFRNLNKIFTWAMCLKLLIFE